MLRAAHLLNQSCSFGTPLSLPACSALLFCSPEVYTSNHKTEILDEAFDAVLKRLGAPRSKHLIRDRLWVRDTKGRWCESSDAGELLVQHHKQHWAPLVRCTYPLLCLVSRNSLKRVGCQLTCGATVSAVACLIQHDWNRFWWLCRIGRFTVRVVWLHVCACRSCKESCWTPRWAQTGRSSARRSSRQEASELHGTEKGLPGRKIL